MEHKKCLEQHVDKENKPLRKDNNFCLSIVKPVQKMRMVKEVNKKQKEKSLLYAIKVISGIREDISKTQKQDVKLRYFRGTTIEDMKDDIKLILKKEPNFITIHLGTNNVISMTFNVNLNKLLHLKSTIIDVYKIIEIIIFEPMMQIDNGKATSIFVTYQKNQIWTLSKKKKKTEIVSAYILEVRDFILIDIVVADYC